MELNPGFDGKLTNFDGTRMPKIENGVAIEMGFVSDNVTDISPLRVFAGLKTLACPARGKGKGKLLELSPLRGMRLTEFKCQRTAVSDLSSLKEMPLTKLDCTDTAISNISSLQGMPLKELICGGTNVSDLSPLKGMPLTVLWCNTTKVADLSQLAGLPLLKLCAATRSCPTCRQLRI